MRKPAKQRQVNNSSKNGKAMVAVSPHGGEMPINKGGRPKGSQNQTTKRLRHALFLAAEVSGDLTPARNDDGTTMIVNKRVVLLNDDGSGDRFLDYMVFLSREHPVTFAHMLSRYIPAEVKYEERNAPVPEEQLFTEDAVLTFLRKQGASEQVARLAAKSMIDAKKMVDADKKRRPAEVED